MICLFKSACTAAAVSAIVVFGLPAACLAQAIVPSPLTQEVLVKSNLLTLNDAIATDNYAVLHDKLSKPFRDQFSVEKIKAIFKDFADKHAVFDIIAAKPIIPDAEAKIDDNGVLRLAGHFETTPKQVKYRLGFIPSEGVWKLSAIKVDIE